MNRADFFRQTFQVSVPLALLLFAFIGLNHLLCSGFRCVIISQGFRFVKKGQLSIDNIQFLRMTSKTVLVCYPELLQQFFIVAVHTLNLVLLGNGNIVPSTLDNLMLWAEELPE